LFLEVPAPIVPKSYILKPNCRFQIPISNSIVILLMTNDAVATTYDTLVAVFYVASKFNPLLVAVLMVVVNQLLKGKPMRLIIEMLDALLEIVAAQLKRLRGKMKETEDTDHYSNVSSRPDDNIV